MSNRKIITNKNIINLVIYIFILDTVYNSSSFITYLFHYLYRKHKEVSKRCNYVYDKDDHVEDKD